MKGIEETIREERENCKSNRFSINSFSKLMLHYLNDADHVSNVIKTKGDVATVIATYPVKDFRKVMMNVLLDFGVDKSDAKKVLKEYNFKSKSLEGLYNFMSDFIYQYLQTGRSFELFKKEDSYAAIRMDEVDEKEKIYDVRDIRHEGKVIGKTKKKYHKHKKILIKNSCPKWQTETLDPDTNKVLKFMKLVK